MVQRLNWIRPPARLSSPPTDPSAAIRVAGVWIRAQVSGITLWVERSSPPCAGLHPPPPCFPLYPTTGADKLTDDRRLPAMRRVAQPFHRVAVTPHCCLINAGEVATTWDTNSRAPVFFSTSDRRASCPNSRPPPVLPIN
jgi:hypothetical protein